MAVARFQVRYRGKAPGDLDPKIFELGAAALRRLETALSTTPFLVGEYLSLADVALVAYTRVAHEGGFDLSAYPAVQGWIARVEEGLGITA